MRKEVHVAKSKKVLQKLGFIDIVICADADVIKQAYDARVRIDALLEEREAAYKRVRELEDEIEQIVGKDGVFTYPPPPLPVAGNARAIESKRQRAVGGGDAKIDEGDIPNGDPMEAQDKQDVPGTGSTSGAIEPDDAVATETDSARKESN